MKEIIQKIKQAAMRADIAASVDAQPTDGRDSMRVRIILKPRSPAKAGETPVHPVDLVRDILGKLGIKFSDISYFPDACVSVLLSVPAVAEQPTGNKTADREE